MRSLAFPAARNSSVCAALCVEALGKDRVIGVLMPNGTQSDISDSRQLVEHGSNGIRLAWPIGWGLGMALSGMFVLSAVY